MIAISGTVMLDQTPKGGDSVDLMTSLLRAREAADACYALAEQAENRRDQGLAEVWSGIAELQVEIVRRTATAVERVRDESHAGASEDGESVTDEQDLG